MVTRICSALLFSILLFWAPPVQADLSLSFGIYTADKPTEVVREFKPALKSLETSMTKKLGKPVRIKMQIANSYEKGISDVETGKVDFARLGPASYVELKHRQPGIRIIVMESKRGSKRFNGIICVAKDSPIQRVEDLLNKRVAFGDPRSTIGRYLAQQYLMRHGIHSAHLAHYEYLGRHDKVGHAVGNGQFDAGALKEATFKRLVSKGVPIRAIAEFPNVTKPWVTRVGLDDKLYAALRDSLLELRDPVVLKALSKDGFLPGHDKDYEMIRYAMETNEAFFVKP